MSEKYVLRQNVLPSKKNYKIEHNIVPQFKKILNDREIFTSTVNGRTEYYHTTNHWENIRRKYGK